MTWRSAGWVFTRAAWTTPSDLRALVAYNGVCSRVTPEHGCEFDLVEGITDVDLTLLIGVAKLNVESKHNLSTVLSGVPSALGPVRCPDGGQCTRGCLVGARCKRMPDHIGVSWQAS